MQSCKILIASTDFDYNLFMAKGLSNDFAKTFSYVEITGLSQSNPLTNANRSFDLVFLGKNKSNCDDNCYACTFKNICPAALISSYIAKDTTIFLVFNQMQRNFNNKFLPWPSSKAELQEIIIEYLSSHLNQQPNNKIIPETSVNEAVNPNLPKKETPTDNFHDEPSHQQNTQVSKQGKFGQLCMHLELSNQERLVLPHIMQKQLQGGFQLFYLPLMPTWCMTLCEPPDTCGPNLSDLLLGIHQECPPNCEELSHYLQKHSSGYYQFRPPERADDLICCELEYLRQLIVLVRKKLENSRVQTTCWLDLRNISMQIASRLAVMCDCILLDIEPGESFAQTCARRELSLLLASLPNTCAIYEKSEHYLQEQGIDLVID